MAKLEYLTCCVESDGKSITDMVEHARPVTLATFRGRCNTAQWERCMGYDRGAKPGRGLPLSRDWHVAFFRSVYRGEHCYYAVHSAIEYIFTNQLT